jgi:hypothetical protein
MFQYSFRRFCIGFRWLGTERERNLADLYDDGRDNTDLWYDSPVPHFGNRSATTGSIYIHL